MIQRDTTIGKIEWLESCCPKGERCFDGKTHCQYVWYDTIIMGIYHESFCRMYHLGLKSGRKCQMCVDIKNLENLEHIKGV